MKILILTGKFGMGHMKAAEAIKEELTLCREHPAQRCTSRESDIEIIDWIEYMAPFCAKYIYGSYSALIRRSTVFYTLHYKSSENRPISQKPDLACYIRMNQLIHDKKPDLIISVLAYASKAVSYYKALSGSSIPLITCVTDITAHSEWINNHTNVYAVGSEEVRQLFARKGIPEGQIYVTGIPVRQRFKNQEAERNSRPKILLMGGGLGLLPKRLDFYQHLSEKVPADMTLITGKNEKLYRKLHGRFKNIHVLGYVKDIDAYFLCSDLVITKPGGITTFEAIYSETPILALNPTMRQEKYNAAFISKHEIGRSFFLENDAKDAERIAALICNSTQIEHYKQRMRQLKKAYTACTLTEIVNELTAALPLGGTFHDEIFSFNF